MIKETIKEFVFMSLTLDFSPAEERVIQERAQREGISLSEYARRQLLAQSSVAEEPEWKKRLEANRRRDELEREAAAIFAASGTTEEELETFVQQAVEKGRAQIHAQEAQQ